MATFEESFLYPLFLLLIGAGVSGLLVAWLTNRWQNHRKELEIKVDIVSKMAEVMAKRRQEVAFSLEKRKQTFTVAEMDAFYENRNELGIDAELISSKLLTYFPEADIKDKWFKYDVILATVGNASRLYFQEPPEKGKLKRQLETIKKYFSDNKQIGWEQIDWDRLTSQMTYDDELWLKVRSLVLLRGREIVREVLKFPIKVF
jgi:hypothetical protein